MTGQVLQPSFADPHIVGEPFRAYSHVAKAGELVCVAGQVGMDRHNRPVEEDLLSQTLRHTRTCAFPGRHAARFGLVRVR